VDAEGINASRTVIITTEKIVDADVIRRDPNRTIIPGFRVAAVVEQPWGAHPMHLSGFYSGDMFGYMAEIGKEASYETYLNRWSTDEKLDEYLKEREALKGKGYFEKLRIEQSPASYLYRISTDEDGVEPSACLLQHCEAPSHPETISLTYQAGNGIASERNECTSQ
jgi:hypothetical protein